MFKMKLAEKDAVLNGYQPYWSYGLIMMVLHIIFVAWIIDTFKINKFTRKNQ